MDNRDNQLLYGHGLGYGNGYSKRIPFRSFGSQESLVNGQYFSSYWTEEDVRCALETGKAFKTVLRVNAYKRSEAYCTVDGIPIDILIDGSMLQNRTVMCEAIGRYGWGYVPPTVNRLRGPLLEAEVADFEEMRKKHENKWSMEGCTLMSDGWTDQKGRTIINFLVNSAAGSFYLYSIDASSFEKTAEFIARTLDDAMQNVGIKNVVQICTDNAANYVRAGKILMDKYPHLYWTPCVAHCIDLILEDIGKIPTFKKVITSGRQITSYIYSHSILHSEFLQLSSNKELVRCGVTRFATSFLTLQNLRDNRYHLGKLDWQKWLGVGSGEEVHRNVFARAFWAGVEDCLKASQPLVALLRLVDSDHTPCMGFISQFFDKASSTIDTHFVDKPVLLKTLKGILKKRLEKHFNHDLFHAGAFLNPEFYYELKTTRVGFVKALEYEGGFQNCILRMIEDEEEQRVIMEQLTLYKEQKGHFASRLAIQALSNNDPMAWWGSFGITTPQLMIAARCILGLCCTASSCERNWSTFDFVDGDTVAIVIDPVKSWAMLKGSSDNFGNPLVLNNSNMHAGEFDGVNTINKDKVYADSQDGNRPNSLEISRTEYASQQSMSTKAVNEICFLLSVNPTKRPSGRVVAIIEKSNRRNAIIGFLSTPLVIYGDKMHNNQMSRLPSKKNKKHALSPAAMKEHVVLIPNDPRLPNMVIFVTSLPLNIKERLKTEDPTVKMELVVAKINTWSEYCILPEAVVIQTLGRGGEIETQISAIFLENAIPKSTFTSETLSCLSDIPQKIPVAEVAKRKDLRHLCTITIDPSSAVDLDDALSIEKIDDDTYRVGIHIVDASHYVLPDTVLDSEAQIRSTSVYMLQHKLPMLPPLLSETLASLLPGEDRLAFSIIFDLKSDGCIIDQWIGHSVIVSCCKLSYECAQDIIDGSFGYNDVNTSRYALHGNFRWDDIVWSVNNLHEISKKLRESRFNNGALLLESDKLMVLFDECGAPYETILSGMIPSNFIIEEFMLLANKTIAEIISKAFPERSLLRRHPEPNIRKLKEFKSFWMKHGFELDVSSSSQFHISLSKIREMLKDDPILFDIIIFNASKPMQLASYFCTGDLADRKYEWAHYSLAFPIYTHFTSPLRRYPDIIVHRTLSAVVEAEEIYMQQKRLNTSSESISKCFTGLNFDQGAFESKEGREALCASALKYKVPCTSGLSEISSYCNKRRLASRRAEDAAKKALVWDLLRKKEIFISEARVMSLGPKFMSVYIHKLGIERRINYSEVEGIIVEWLEVTSTLVLNLLANRHFKKNSSHRGYPLENLTLIVNPSDFFGNEDSSCNSDKEDLFNVCLDHQGTLRNDKTHPALFPLTLKVLSAVPVVVHAIGGDDGPIDMAARLYTCSFFS